MRALKTRWFGRWAAEAGITDVALSVAVEEIEHGLIDARLGSHLIKKRVPLRGRGKRGGARTMLAYRHGEMAIFIYGFAKNERDDVSPQALASLRKLVSELLRYDEPTIARMIDRTELIELERR